MPKTSIEIPQPIKRAPIVVDLEGNSEMSVEGTSVAAVKVVSIALIIMPAMKGKGRVVSGCGSSVERICMLLLSTAVTD